MLFTQRILFTRRVPGSDSQQPSRVLSGTKLLKGFESILDRQIFSSSTGSFRLKINTRNSGVGGANDELRCRRRGRRDIGFK